MARRDAFIELLHQKGADALVMQPGAAAMLEGPGPSSQSIIKRMLTSQQIVSAVAELLHPSAAQGFDGSEDEEAVYVSPAARVLGRFMRTAPGVRAERRPESAPPRAEDPPAAGQPELVANVQALHAVKVPRLAEPPASAEESGRRSVGGRAPGAALVDRAAGEPRTVARGEGHRLRPRDQRSALAREHLLRALGHRRGAAPHPLDHP